MNSQYSIYFLQHLSCSFFNQLAILILNKELKVKENNRYCKVQILKYVGERENGAIVQASSSASGKDVFFVVLLLFLLALG